VQLYFETIVFLLLTTWQVFELKAFLFKNKTKFFGQNFFSAIFFCPFLHFFVVLFYILFDMVLTHLFRLTNPDVKNLKCKHEKNAFVLQLMQTFLRLLNAEHKTNFVIDHC
jgi:hypothetical protein